MTKSALVCGAGGFIGAHLVRRLRRDGYFVRGVDIKRPEYTESDADEFVVSDLRDLTACQAVFDRRFDEVYQLAADMGGAGFVFTGQNDADILRNSVRINLNVIQTSQQGDVGRVFFSSSACVYPRGNQADADHPVTREDSVYPADPDSDYGFEKLFAERLYLAAARNDGVVVRIARYHNVFGPECAWRGGREKAPAALCRKVAEAGDGGKIEMWGDGRQTRSFLYIDECIEGTLRVMRSGVACPVNIGSEEMITINELAEAIAAIAGKRISLVHVPGPQGVRARRSDNEFAREHLKWAPSLPLASGLETTYRWIAAQIAAAGEARSPATPTPGIAAQPASMTAGASRSWRATSAAGAGSCRTSKSMSEPQPGGSGARPQPAGRARLDLPELAWRVTGALTSADRRALALRLLETEAEEITFRRDGTIWTAFPWDHVISQRLFVYGSFQGPEVRAVLAWMSRHRRFAAPRDVVVDIGANIGTSTIPFARETGCRVLAIEPVPEIFAVLCRNVADNGLAARVSCVQAAISMAGGDRVRMILPAGNGGGGEVNRPNREASFARRRPVRGVVDVPATGLADLLDARGVGPERVAFVWSDTQGCEADVIESGSPLWAAGVPLFAEFDPGTWGDANGAEALLAAAATRFAGFIAAATLIAYAAAQPRPMAELAAFCRTLGPEGGDVLLLPEGFGLAPGSGRTARA